MPLSLVKSSQGYMLSQALPAFGAIGQSGLKWHKNGLLEKKNVHRCQRTDTEMGKGALQASGCTTQVVFPLRDLSCNGPRINLQMPSSHRG